MVDKIVEITSNTIDFTLTETDNNNVCFVSNAQITKDILQDNEISVDFRTNTIDSLNVVVNEDVLVDIIKAVPISTTVVESGIKQYLAGEDIPAYSPVYLRADNLTIGVAKGNDLTHFRRYIGINTASTTVGNFAPVRITGELHNPSWNFDPNIDVYVGENGGITQNPNFTDYEYYQQVGNLLAVDSIFVTQLKPTKV